MASQVHVSVTGSLTSVKTEQGKIGSPKVEVAFTRGKAKGIYGHYMDN